MATILITGGTGMIGQHLTKMLISKGFEVIVLCRSLPKIIANNCSYAKWNIDNNTIDIDAIKKADYIIHLAGANVAEKRWTDARKKEILESRTKSSNLIIKALTENENKVIAVISASAIGWYGSDTKLQSYQFKEEDKPFDDFLGTTCKKWEDSILPVQQLHKRLVILRTGIVLCKAGGALKEFLKPLQMGIATILGNGNQKISWIHVTDLCNLFIFAIENNTLKGVYNAVAPMPVSNKALVIELAKIVRNKFYIPIYVPSFFLKIILGEMSIEVLKSCTVSASKIEHAGFRFQFSTINDALKNLITK